MNEKDKKKSSSNSSSLTKSTKKAESTAGETIEFIWLRKHWRGERDVQSLTVSRTRKCLTFLRLIYVICLQWTVVVFIASPFLSSLLKYRSTSSYIVFFAEITAIFLCEEEIDAEWASASPSNLYGLRLPNDSMMSSTINKSNVDIHTNLCHMFVQVFFVFYSSSYFFYIISRTKQP